MRRIVLVSRAPHAKHLRRSISRFLRATGRPWPVEHIDIGPMIEPGTGGESDAGHADPATVFCRLAQALGGAPDSASEMRATTAVIELFDPQLEDPEDLHASGVRCPWVRVACMLILGFPEVQWVLLTPYPPSWIVPPSSDGLGGDPGVLSAAHLMHDSTSLRQILELTEAGYAPLFDPSALRHLIRARMKALDPKEEDLRYVRLWVGRGAAVDEECSYAYFNAYLLYRFGLVAHVITRYRSMCAVFGYTRDHFSEPSLAVTVPDAVLEDVYLNFPDRPVGVHLSALEWERDKCFPALQEVRHRVLVTVGRGGGASREVWRANARYLAGLRANGRTARMLFKPGAGIFELWRRSGLATLVRGRKAEIAPREATGEVLPASGHSAPGRLLLIAEDLIKRGRAILGQPASVEDAVHAATLAVDARALLGGRTPTTSLEALALQHEAEALAESLFLGIEYNLDVRARVREIEREVAEVATRFQPATRVRASLSARLTIVERLAKQFRDLNQIEEELACLAEARKLRFDFWVRERSWRWIFWPFLQYLAFALYSLPRFAVALVAWVGLFGLAYYLLGPLEGRDPTLAEAIGASTVFFFTLQPAEGWTSIVGAGRSGWDTLWNFFLAFQGLVSFTNLGLFLSHLFLMVSRR